MASRNAVPQQNRGEAVVHGAAINKQKNMVAERKSRRALGDIGNLVTVKGVDVKQIPQVSRPITRSFCAQLLAKAQAVENNKNQTAVNVDVEDGNILQNKKVVARKPPQKKPAAAKPMPREIMEISPHNEAEEKSLKKNKPSFTGALTARSKAACGLDSKPKEQIADIDAADANNHLAVVEYVEDMYKFYKLAQHEGHVHDYMDSQPEINEKMRAILIDWLIQVHHKFELSQETLYLTINIVDRYLASETTPRKELQLVGMSSMLIASKYEEIWAPEVEELVCVSDRTYTNEQVLIMEKRILGALGWYLTVPTPYVFLVRFIKASQADSDVEDNMVYYLAELGMMNYATLVYCPSMIAASAVYAARRTLSKAPIWNETLRAHTGYSEAQVLDCAKLLISFHSMASAAGDHQKLRGAYKKYSSSEKGAVALMPPAKSIL